MKTKKERGICGFWGCKQPATIAMHSHGAKDCASLVCSRHWTCAGPMNTPSYADFHKNGTAHFDIEVIAR